MTLELDTEEIEDMQKFGKISGYRRNRRYAEIWEDF